MTKGVRVTETIVRQFSKFHPEANSSMERWKLVSIIVTVVVAILGLFGACIVFFFGAAGWAGLVYQSWQQRQNQQVQIEADAQLQQKQEDESRRIRAVEEASTKGRLEILSMWSPSPGNASIIVRNPGKESVPILGTTAHFERIIGGNVTTPPTQEDRAKRYLIDHGVTPLGSEKPESPPIIVQAGETVQLDIAFGVYPHPDIRIVIRFGKSEQVEDAIRMRH